MGYYPDMSSQAAAQGYFSDLIAQALNSAPVARRVAGQPALYFDVGSIIVPATGSIGVGPNLGGRGVIGALVTWNSTAVLGSPPRAVISGNGFSIFNPNGVDATAFWLAVGVA